MMEKGFQCLKGKKLIEDLLAFFELRGETLG